MLQRTIDETIKSVSDTYDYEKVSDLTKEQFTELLSKSIYEVVNSRDFIDSIGNQLALANRRRR